MNRLFSITFLSLLFICQAFAQTETLTNEDVILMTQSGLGKDLIITKVKDSDGNYDVSTKSLIELKKAGVADEVIKIMLEKPKKSASTDTANSSIEKIVEPSNSVQKVSNTSNERIVLSLKKPSKTPKLSPLRNPHSIPPDKNSKNLCSNAKTGRNTISISFVSKMTLIFISKSDEFL